MLFKEYINGINHSLRFPDSMPAPMYLGLGIMGEGGELVQKLYSPASNLEDIIKEAGDVLWYISMFLRETGCTLFDVMGTDNFADAYITMQDTVTVKDNPVEDFALQCLLLSEHFKKVARDNNSQVHVRIIEIKGTLYHIIRHLLLILIMYKLDITEVLQTNIDKLQKRKKDNTIQGDGDNR